MHSGQSLLLISMEYAQWTASAPHFSSIELDIAYRTCTVGSLSSSFGPRKLGSMEYAQWAAFAPHFRYTELDI